MDSTFLNSVMRTNETNLMHFQQTKATKRCKAWISKNTDRTLEFLQKFKGSNSWGTQKTTETITNPRQCKIPRAETNDLDTLRISINHGETFSMRNSDHFSGINLVSSVFYSVCGGFRRGAARVLMEVIFKLRLTRILFLVPWSAQEKHVNGLKIRAKNRWIVSNADVIMGVIT